LVRLPTGQGYKEAETKTKKSRRGIALTSFAIDALRKHGEVQQKQRDAAGPFWHNNDYVFSKPMGEHLDPGYDVLVQLKMLLKKANLPDIRFHDLRHSTATFLFALGVHPKVVQEILGHSEIGITMDIYSHLIPTMQSDAMQKLHEEFQVKGGDAKNGQDNERQDEEQEEAEEEKDE
jgi:integrase